LPERLDPEEFPHLLHKCQAIAEETTREGYLDVIERRLHRLVDFLPMALKRFENSAIPQKLCLLNQSMASMRRIAADFKLTTTEPPDSVRLVNEKNLSEWETEIDRPLGTIWEEGVFKLLVIFPPEYPLEPISPKAPKKIGGNL
jgi:hypothetical protein